MGLILSISTFFTNKIALADIWMSFSCSKLALAEIENHSVYFKHFSLHLKIFAEHRSNKTLGEEARTKLETLRQTFQEEIRPVWKKEFISLYCFLPWYVNYLFRSLISKTEREKTLRVSNYCFLPSLYFWNSQHVWTFQAV